jgi:hypothetical protein
MRPSLSQVSSAWTGQVRSDEPRAISTGAPAGLAIDDEDDAAIEDLDPAAAVIALPGSAIEPSDLGTAQAAGKTDQQDGAIAPAAQVLLQHRDHRQNVLGEQRFFLSRRPAVAAADAGHDVDNMAILAGEGSSSAAIGRGDRGQAALDRRDGSPWDARAVGRGGDE